MKRIVERLHGSTYQVTFKPNFIDRLIGREGGVKLYVAQSDVLSMNSSPYSWNVYVDGSGEPTSIYHDFAVVRELDAYRLKNGLYSHVRQSPDVPAPWRS